MSSFADQWARAGQEQDDFDPPDGGHQTVIVDGGAFAGKDGREWAKVVLRITEGEHKDREFDDFMNLNTEVGLRIAREKLALYGVDPDGVTSLQELDTRIKQLKGTLAQVVVKHKDNWLNITVHMTRRAPLNGDQVAPPAAQPAAVGAAAPAGVSFAQAAGTGTEDDDKLPF